MTSLLTSRVPEARRRLVLLRHGQTSWNLERRGQGHTDIELDETGQAQAAAMAPFVAALGPIALWSSDLQRAAQTAAHVGLATGLDVRTDVRLREFDLGARTGMTMAEYADAHPEEYADFVAGRIEVTPGGETNAAVAARMRAALTDALAGLAPGETSVVVGHGGALKVAVLSLLGWPDEVWTTLHGLDNCHWAVLDHLGDGVADGVRLEAWNLSAPPTDPGYPDFATDEGVG